ncbi:hypothetical protein [Aliarcobacter butzleri]|jgi:hypothetical protein|uniref:hypothetical protein n=1 Tax=Aliarcobacter butzleri TaxID=28197 RepID=UPI0021B3350D|nr:hypothetical protein [Aliarcobacter butzleri]MCT7588993.1 hypothetical protein [Aliarcobacter butzleri]MCT7628939.1 hypothetical protein [Aliarcobacter butzleri]
MVKGGIEPEVINTSTLSLNIFYYWGTANIGENSIFTVKIIRLDAADIASFNNLMKKIIKD